MKHTTCNLSCSSGLVIGTVLVAVVGSMLWSLSGFIH